MNPTVPHTQGKASTADVNAARLRRARLQEQIRRSKLQRRLVTPEGAAIHLKLATASERAGAFMIDVAIQWAIVIATALGLSFAMMAMDSGSANVAWAVWLPFFFFVRHFFLLFF